MATYTYSGDPSSSSKDAVRFLLSDKSDPWLFSDEEILYEISIAGSVYSAAAELAVVQSTKYTDKADKTVGPLSIKYGDLASRWVELSKSLKGRGGRVGGAVAIMTQKSREKIFSLGMHDIDGSELSGIVARAEELKGDNYA